MKKLLGRLMADAEREELEEGEFEFEEEPIEIVPDHVWAQQRTPCPNEPHSPSLGEWTRFSRGKRFCKRDDCSFCPSAGYEWTSGFCMGGHWRKKPHVDAGPALLPPVWSKLPPELLGPVVARLPTTAIGRARTLSKDWNRALSSSSGVAKECGKVQPNLHGFVGFNRKSKECWVRAYEPSLGKWHAFNIDSIPQTYARSIRASDAGLVCVVPYCGDSSFYLQPALVVNPLTREWKQLPLQQFVVNQASMVQMRVDRATGAYKVTLVGQRELKDGVMAEVFDSQMQKWTAVVSGKVMDFFWPWPPRDPNPGLMELGVFDCVSHELRKYDVSHFPPRPLGEADVPTLEGYNGPWEVQGLAILQNDLYLLESIPPSGLIGGCTTYNVSKYVEGKWGIGSRFGNSIGVATFNGSPQILAFEMDDLCLPMTLYACKTFFLVLGGDVDSANLIYMKLYDVETEKWTGKLELQIKDSDWHSISGDDLDTAVLCELRWDARP